MAADQTFKSQHHKSVKEPCSVLAGSMLWKPMMCFALILTPVFKLGRDFFPKASGTNAQSCYSHWFVCLEV